MNESVIKIDDTVDRVIKTIFDSRIQKENVEPNLDSFSKSVKIKSLQHKILAFIHSNPISNINITLPDVETDKEIKLMFSNICGENESDVTIVVKDNWEHAEVTYTPLLGFAKPHITLKAD